MERTHKRESSPHFQSYSTHQVELCLVLDLWNEAQSIELTPFHAIPNDPLPLFSIEFRVLGSSNIVYNQFMRERIRVSCNPLSFSHYFVHQWMTSAHMNANTLTWKSRYLAVTRKNINACKAIAHSKPYVRHAWNNIQLRWSCGRTSRSIKKQFIYLKIRTTSQRKNGKQCQ